MNLNVWHYWLLVVVVVAAEKCTMTYKKWGQHEMLRFLNYYPDDNDNASFYIGGLNALYRLSYQDRGRWKTHERIGWQGDTTTKKDCVMRGNPSRECENYIRAALLSEQHITLCGTNGQLARLSTRDLFNNVSVETEKKGSDGNLRCSSDPRAVPTQISLTYNNKTNILLATKNRLFSSHGLSTNIYTYEQLNVGAEVVSLVDHGKHIYIFLNEEDVIGKTTTRIVVARVARICKNDLGYKKKWTSFVKTTLRCDGDGDFTHIRAVSTLLRLGDSLFIFIIFHTKKYPWLYDQKFSALCVYEIRDIERTFLASSLMKRDDTGCWMSLHQPWNIDGTLATNLANCHYVYDEEKFHYVNSHPILNTTVYGRLVLTSKPYSALLAKVAVVKNDDNKERLEVYLLHQDNAILKLGLNVRDWSITTKRKLILRTTSPVSFFDILKGRGDNDNLLLLVSDSRVMAIQCNI